MSWEIKQRVNFYLDEFQPPKIPDDLKMILIGAGLHVGIAVVVLLGLVINWYWQGHRLEGMQERQAIVEQQVANIESERPPLKLDDALVAQRAKLREDLESSQRILRYLTQQELDSSTSFTTMVKELGIRMSEESGSRVSPSTTRGVTSISQALPMIRRKSLVTFLTFLSAAVFLNRHSVLLTSVNRKIAVG